VDCSSLDLFKRLVSACVTTITKFCFLSFSYYLAHLWAYYCPVYAFATVEKRCRRHPVIRYVHPWVNEWVCATGKPSEHRISTRSSANTEEPCEHTVTWNRVKCCTSVWRIAFAEACNGWMIFKVIQGYCRCCHLIGYVRFPISFPLQVYLSCAIQDINTYLPKN